MSKTNSESLATRLLCDTLQVFSTPSSSDFERGLRYVLSAVAFVGIERNALPSRTQFDGARFASQEVKNSLSCALHYHKLQTSNHQARSTEDQTNCAKYISELVDSIYGMLEALASIHAKSRHHHEISQLSTSQERIESEAEFLGLGKEIDINNIKIEALAPLAAFLCAGVKGLLIYPRNQQRFTQVKLAHFIIVSDTLQKNKTIEEPVWKRTQSLILQLIADAIFPEGIPDIETVGSVGIQVNEWSHKEISKFNLSNALQLDLEEFCLSRDQFVEGFSNSYPNPPFEIPDCPVNITKKFLKHR